MIKRAFNKIVKIVVSFVIILALFIPYDLLFRDRVLDELRFSYSRVAYAYGISDIAGMDILLNRAITRQILSSKLSSKELMDLEVARNIITGGKTYLQLDQIKTALKEAIKEKEDKRGFLFTLFDKISSILKNGLTYLIHLPQYFKKTKVEPITKEGIQLLADADELEKGNELKEAAPIYENFAQKYPYYENIPLVKLRLAYIYHRIGEFDKARALYKDIIKSNFTVKESVIAQSLLIQLNGRNRLIKRINYLLVKASELPDENELAKQEIFYEIGVINTELFNFEEAKKFFKRANNINPESELGQRSLFSSAWISKETGSLKESILEFTSLAKRGTGTALGLDSQLQIADLLRKEGHFEEAVNMYLKIVDANKDSPLAPICLFQAAASYLYDLNNEEKSKAIFQRLIKEYPNSAYSKYLAPQNPVGMFLTYIVPRAMRVVSWRAGGLLCLTGYSGKVAKFKAVLDQNGFNQQFNDWAKKEFPETIGNIYFDLKGTEFEFLKDKGTAKAMIIMDKFSVPGHAEGRLEMTKEQKIDLKITKAFLDKIPIAPFVINNTLTGLSLMYRKNFPIIIKNISMKDGEVTGEGYGSKRMLERITRSAKELVGVDIQIEEIKDPAEQKEIYSSLSKDFPENGFSPEVKDDLDSVFLDFFTRMYLYSGFKLLESVKDTKFDYERSVRTLGLLQMKRVKFGVTYSDADINTSLNRLINAEFPWLVNDEFIYDVRGFEFHFTDKGEIKFNGHLVLSYGPTLKTYDLKIRGGVELEPDKETGIPRLIIKEMYLNDKPYPVDKLNLVTLRGLNMLKDGSLPIKLKEARINEGAITLKGEGAQDFLSRVFSGPYLFVIFQIREWDLWAAGIKRLGKRQEDVDEFWRGKGYGKEKESAIIGGQTGRPFKQYQYRWDDYAK